MKKKLALFALIVLLLVIAESFAMRKLGLTPSYIESLNDFNYLLYLVGIVILMAFNYYIISVVSRKIMED